jgi:hypothetical protein
MILRTRSKAVFLTSLAMPDSFKSKVVANVQSKLKAQYGAELSSPLRTMIRLCVEYFLTLSRLITSTRF